MALEISVRIVAAVFAADEAPDLAADGQAAERAFGGVVVDSPLAVVGVAAQRLPLIQELVHARAFPLMA